MDRHRPFGQIFSPAEEILGKVLTKSLPTRLQFLTYGRPRDCLGVRQGLAMSLLDGLGNVPSKSGRSQDTKPSRSGVLRIRRWPAVLAASLTFLVATGMPALADVVTADTDTVSSGFQKTVTITDCSVAHTNSAAAVIQYGGGVGSHFADGASVTVTATPNAAGLTAVGGLVALPTPWDHLSPDKSVSTSITVPAHTATGSYGVTLTASGLKVGNGTLTISDSYTVVVNCTVADTTPPAVTVPGNITAEATSSAGAVVTFTASASDTVDGVLTVLTPTCSRTSGSTFALGTTTVTCSATDAAGNPGSASFTITVQDTIAPSVSAPLSQVIEATGPAGAVATFANGSATDAVDGSLVAPCTPASSSTFVLGATPVTCSATDAHGNKGSATFTITVRDTSGPVLSGVPASTTIAAVNASGAPFTFTLPTASDLVDGPQEVLCNATSGASFPLGPTTVTCTSSDLTGHSSSAQFVVTVADLNGPALSLPADITAEATGSDGAAVSYTASASDNVDLSSTVVCSPLSRGTFALGETTVNCSATDAAGNITKGHFKVTVTDHTPPTIDVPASQTVEATSAAGAKVTFDPATATDIVDGSVDVTCNATSGDVFALGTTTVTCTATDAHHNPASATFTIKVQDTTPPVLTMPASETFEATSSAGAVVSYAATATDAVDPSPTVACLPASDGAFALGTTTVTCTATDHTGNPGNHSSGSFVVTVVDTTPPVLTLPDNIVAEATGPSGAVVTYTATAKDAVDPSPTVVCSPLSGVTFALGATTVSCTATDASLNASDPGTFTIKVQDTMAPVLTLPANIVRTATSSAGAVVTYSATATDAVDPKPTVVCSPLSGGTFAPGTTTVTCTATDGTGNHSSGSFKVTVGFDFRGFFAPVDNAPTANTMKAGSTAPIKFQVTDGAGGYISSLSIVSVWSGVISCTSETGLEDSLETYATGGTSLRYDATANQFIYNWQSPKAPGACYNVNIRLSDGSVKTALFKLK